METENTVPFIVALIAIIIILIFVNVKRAKETFKHELEKDYPEGSGFWTVLRGKYIKSIIPWTFGRDYYPLP